LEFARLLAADGVNLVLVGRNKAALQEAADKLQTEHRVFVRCEARDLSEPRAAARLWTDVTSGGISIDILINNAGIGLYGEIEQQDADALEAMVQLNVVTLTSLTRLAVPLMKARKWGRILNVGSIVGFQPAGPRWAAYYASKAYVVSFSKGVARELEGSEVSVTLLSPGLTDSAFEERSGASRTRLYKILPKMTAAAVARAGYEGMKRQKSVVIPGLVTKILSFAGEMPPRRIGVEVNHLLLQRASRRT
jgi:short-subunit dehydrogenase